MPQLVSHIFELLYQQGVQHAFGIPGDFALTLYDALTASKIEPIVNNSAFTSLRAMAHEQAPFVNIPTLNYARLAEVLGGRGLVVETGRQLQKALQLARDCDTFSILDVRISPDDLSPGLQRLSSLFAKTLKG